MDAAPCAQIDSPDMQALILLLVQEKNLGSYRPDIDLQLANAAGWRHEKRGRDRKLHYYLGERRREYTPRYRACVDDAISLFPRRWFLIFERGSMGWNVSARRNLDDQSVFGGHPFLATAICLAWLEAGCPR